MSQFVTGLAVLKLTLDDSEDGRGSWRLLKPLVYFCDLLGRHIIVPAGFLTDFASVPRIPIAYLLTGNCGHQAAVIHDWLYTVHIVTRAEADAIFREALLLGVPVIPSGSKWNDRLKTWARAQWVKTRSWLMWAGVRIGGAGPWESGGQRQPQYVESVIDDLHPEGP